MLDLPHAACRPRSAPDMRSRMRSPSHAPSFCFVKPVWLPRNPTSCPNTAKAPCVCTLPARSEAWNNFRGRVSDPPPPRVPGAAAAAPPPPPRRRRRHAARSLLSPSFAAERGDKEPLSPLVSLRGKAVKSDCLPVRRGYALSILRGVKEARSRKGLERCDGGAGRLRW